MKTLEKSQSLDYSHTPQLTADGNKKRTQALLAVTLLFEDRAFVEEINGPGPPTARCCSCVTTPEIQYGTTLGTVASGALRRAALHGHPRSADRLGGRPVVRQPRLAVQCACARG
eukprot:scaffold7644_cov140-Isochrysis_galbana.AAC.2